MRWDWEDTEPNDDGTRVFETDLRFSVGLTAGYVGSSQLEMLPCIEGTRVSLKPQQPWWQHVLDWIDPRKA